MEGKREGRKRGTLPCAGNMQRGVRQGGTVGQGNNGLLFSFLLPLSLEMLYVIQAFFFFHSDCQPGHPPAAGAESDPDLGKQPEGQ